MKTILKIEGIQVTIYPADKEMMEVDFHYLDEDRKDIDPDCPRGFTLDLEYDNIRYLAQSLLQAADCFEKTYKENK